MPAYKAAKIKLEKVQKIAEIGVDFFSEFDFKLGENISIEEF